jgi:hypothetical protein
MKASSLRRALPSARKIHVLAACAALLAGASMAQAHTIVGDRIFPATLAIDDPGVNDELTLPAFTYMTAANPDGSPGTISYSLGWEYSKTITSTLALSVGSEGFRWGQRPNAQGWANIETKLKYVIWQDAPSQAIVATALGAEWGNTGSPQSASLPSDPFTTLSFKLFAGKGFGDAPADWIKPFAVTGEFDANFPMTAANADGSVNPTTVTYGATVQYSLLYMNSTVRELPEIFRRLIPAFEASFATPVGNFGQPDFGGFGTNVTTGIVGPSLYYVGNSFQVGVMAAIPINAESGSHVGVLAAIDFYLDDIFPNSIGKPMFGASQRGRY